QAPGGLIGDVSAGGLGEVRGAAAASTEVAGAKLLVSGASESANGWVPVRTGRGPADTDLTLRDASASGQAQVDVGRALLSARITAFNEDRGAGTRGALSKDSGGQASFTLSQLPTATDLGWRLQGWLSTSNLTNTAVSVGAGRRTATPAND